jgi:hypothetical protein
LAKSKSDVSSVPSTCELIFCLPGDPKIVLIEVEKAMFQRVDWPYKLIFCLVAGTKCDLGDVKFVFDEFDKEKVQGVAFSCGLILFS